MAVSYGSATTNYYSSFVRNISFVNRTRVYSCDMTQCNRVLTTCLTLCTVITGQCVQNTNLLLSTPTATTNFGPHRVFRTVTNWRNSMQSLCQKFFKKRVSAMTGHHVSDRAVWCDNRYSMHKPNFNHLTPNGHYMGRTAKLTSSYCILYIYSRHIRTEYFKYAA